MSPAAAVDLAPILARFALAGRCLGWERYGNGHINDTFLVRYDQCGTPARWIVQRLNGAVFPRPTAVMENIAAVTGRLRDPLADPRSSLCLVPGRDGRPWIVDAAGAVWRCYPFIEGSRTIERVGCAAHAYGAARCFADFLARLDAWDGPRLHEVIEDFHHTPRRLARLAAAMAADPCQRLAAVRHEADWALEQSRWAGALVAARDGGGVPERVCHNDTKINNVLFHADRDEGLCVIDLDTLMPGLSLYDFGDLVRTATATAAEDETDLGRVGSDPKLYAALAEGWLGRLGAVLTAEERRLMPLSGAVITFECGVRFLTDHLEGDRYFRIARPGHNLDRARNQFAMARDLLARQTLG